MPTPLERIDRILSLLEGAHAAIPLQTFIDDDDVTDDGETAVVVRDALRLAWAQARMLRNEVANDERRAAVSVAMFAGGTLSPVRRSA